MSKYTDNGVSMMFDLFDESMPPEDVTIDEDALLDPGAYMSVSMLYLRCAEHIKKLITEVEKEHKSDNRKCDKLGLEYDLHYGILTKFLTNAMTYYESLEDYYYCVAKKLKTPMPKNAGLLANAVVKQAVDDYEIALLDQYVKPQERISEIVAIDAWAKDQICTGLDMEKVLAQIRSIYFKKFIPYAERHEAEIVKDWEVFEEKKQDYPKAKSELAKSDLYKNYKHKCPLCGGLMRNGSGFGVGLTKSTTHIGCTGCRLAVPITDKELVNELMKKDAELAEKRKAEKAKKKAEMRKKLSKSE